MSEWRSVVFSLVVVSVACGGSEAGGPDPARSGLDAEGAATPEATSPSDAPRVEAPYQERIDEAWLEAVAGENPAATCAGVKGRATVSEPGSATRALEACNVDIPVRYFLTYVERVEAGETTCMSLMTEVMTKLSAMTISTEGFRDLARQGESADTSEAAAAGAGAAILAGAAASGGGANDPQRIVKDRLRDPVTRVCPEQADLILR